MTRFRMARSRGFTLIELLVVMAIVATLVTVAAPRYFGSVERARETVLREDLNVMRDTIDKFHGDTGKYPQSLQQLVDKRYLRSIPVDPITDSAKTWVEVQSSDPEVSGMVDVKSGAPGKAADGSDFKSW